MSNRSKTIQTRCKLKTNMLTCTLASICYVVITMWSFLSKLWGINRENTSGAAYLFLIQRKPEHELIKSLYHYKLQAYARIGYLLYNGHYLIFRLVTVYVKFIYIIECPCITLWKTDVFVQLCLLTFARLQKVANRSTLPDIAKLQEEKQQKLIYLYLPVFFGKDLYEYC